MSIVLKRKPDSSVYYSADSQPYYSADPPIRRDTPSAPTERQIRAYGDRLDVQLGRALGKAARSAFDKTVEKIKTRAKPPISTKPVAKPKHTPVPKTKTPNFTPITVKTPAYQLLRGNFSELVPPSAVRNITNWAVGDGYSLIVNSDKTPEAVPALKVERVDHKGQYKMAPKKTLSNTGAFKGVNVSNVRNAPAAISRRMNVVNQPKMRTSRNGVVIHHKEYMSNIMSSAVTLSYNAVGFVLNPGKMSTFPWLSTMSCNFDKYKILRCSISLVSNQPTTVAGRIGVGFDYDSTDPLPVDRTDFFSLTHHAECSAWDSLVFPIPLRGGERFVNSHTVTDSKLIDYGQIVIMADQIVTTGTAINLGDAIIDYDVELIEPQQAIMSTQSVTGKNISSFTDLVTVGPSLGQQQHTTSTTTLDFLLSAGYYSISLNLYDFAGGTPTAAIDHTTGTTGKFTYEGGANVFMINEIIHVINNDGKLRIVFAGVTIANLEGIFIAITRMAPTNYKSASTAGTWSGTIAATL